MPKTLRGVIRGQTIVLETESGLADGQGVEVTVRPTVEPDDKRSRLAALDGSLAHLPEQDWEALDEIVRERTVCSHQDLRLP